MINCDLHLHSSFSEDAEAPMRSMVEEALRRGLSVICFTEHIDEDYPPEDGSFRLDLPAYRQTYLDLKEEYAGRIEILFGVELGMQQHLPDRYRRILREWPFDMAAASLHLVYDRDPWYRQFWDVHTDEQTVLEEYFRQLYANLQLLDDFDVCAHLDYLVRYLPSKDQRYSYAANAALIDPILSWLIQREKCLEVNTSSLAAGLAQPNPCRDILVRYHQMGGRKISIGSDAHSPERIAYGFDRVEQMLRSIGFTSLCVFRGRRAFECSL